MPKPDGDLRRAFEAARRRDMLRALQGREVEISIKGRALYNLARWNLTYPGSEESLFTTLSLVGADLIIGNLTARWLLDDAGIARPRQWVMVFTSSASVIAVLSMLRSTEVEPLAVECDECGEWFRPGDFYDLTEHRSECYICHGCAVAMSGEELIEGYLL
jgi:hypothetical protein